MTVVCTGSEVSSNESICQEFSSRSQDIDLENAERRNLKTHEAKAIKKERIRDARAAINRAAESDSVKAMQEAQLRLVNFGLPTSTVSVP